MNFFQNGHHKLPPAYHPSRVHLITRFGGTGVHQLVGIEGLQTAPVEMSTSRKPQRRKQPNADLRQATGQYLKVCSTKDSK
mmetsp:Transcript_12374/g.16901  ORF Transcript_12374/g.16901 Transcript_12374/m.16901 type:complete len:81 (+) Transcript_12374:383-625(+)